MNRFQTGTQLLPHHQRGGKDREGNINSRKEKNHRGSSNDVPTYVHPNPRLESIRVQPKGSWHWSIKEAMKSCPSVPVLGKPLFHCILPPLCVWGNSYSFIETQLIYLFHQETFFFHHQREQITPFTAHPSINSYT